VLICGSTCGKNQMQTMQVGRGRWCVKDQGSATGCECCVCR
jgi:hypothetical protein